MTPQQKEDFEILKGDPIYTQEDIARIRQDATASGLDQHPEFQAHLQEQSQKLFTSQLEERMKNPGLMRKQGVFDIKASAEANGVDFNKVLFEKGVKLNEKGVLVKDPVAIRTKAENTLRDAEKRVAEAKTAGKTEEVERIIQKEVQPAKDRVALLEREARVGDAPALLKDARQRHESILDQLNNPVGKTAEQIKALKAEGQRIFETEIKPLTPMAAFTQDELDANIRTSFNRNPVEVRTQVEMAQDELSKSHNPTGEGRPGLFEFLADGERSGDSKYFYSPDVGNGDSKSGGAHRGSAYKVFTRNANGTYEYVGMADENGQVTLAPNGDRLKAPFDTVTRFEPPTQE